MKKALLLLALTLSLAYSYGQVLAVANGYKFTNYDFEKEVRFVEFLFNQKLSAADRQWLKMQEIEAFKQAPQLFLQNIQSLDQQMAQLYALTDPLQIGVVRSALIAAVYNEIQNSDEQDAFKQLFDKYVKVLAIDNQNQIALTQADVDAYFDYIEFIYSLYGMPVKFDPQTRQAYTQNLIYYFLYGDQQTKATLAAMDVIANYYKALYQKLSPEQKAQFQQALTAQSTPTQYQNQPYSGNPPNTQRKYSKAELEQILQQMQQRQQLNNMMFNTMNNILLESNAAALNVINNIGSGDTYWEVVDY